MYLRTTLSPVLKAIQEDRALDLELNPLLIHQQIVPGANITDFYAWKY